MHVHNRQLYQHVWLRLRHAPTLIHRSTTEAAADVSLDQETLRRIEEITPAGLAAGAALLS
jgi:hypothetical protein